MLLLSAAAAGLLPLLSPLLSYCPAVLLLLVLLSAGLDETAPLLWLPLLYFSMLRLLVRLPSLVYINLNIILIK